MPSFNNTKENDNIILTLVNPRNEQLIYTNSSYEIQAHENVTAEDDAPPVEYEHWPNWVQKITCVSHLSLAFNASVNFFIYYIKRRALRSGMDFYV